jgi:indole-3-glycerol phosphate synthase
VGTPIVESPATLADSRRVNRRELLEEKRREIAALGGLSVTEVQPSRRDFTLFVATQKREIALIPRLKRADPETRGAWPDLDPPALARAYDETEAAALAVSTAAWQGGSLDDLERVARAVTAAVLRDDLCLHASQLYESRLSGADAVVLPVGELTEAEIRELVGVTRSLHMAPVLEVEADEHLPVAVALGPALVGLRAPGEGGFADLRSARALADRVPAQRTVLLLSEVRRLDDLGELAGAIDAAVVGDALLGWSDPAAALAAFFAGRSES